MNYEKELRVAIEAAKKAGEKTLEFYNSDYKIEIKEDNSPVTEADLASNKILMEILSSNFDYPILSEEVEDDLTRLEHNIIWTIDPIDGTKGFIDKSGYSIIIGLIENKQPVLGVVYIPNEDKLFYATKGGGAFLIENNETKQIKVTDNQNLENFLVLKSKHHPDEIVDTFVQKMGWKEGNRRASVGLKSVYIAGGLADIYIYGKKASQWDYCGPQIIVEEAGGLLTNLKGEKFEYNNKETILPNGLIVSNGKQHNKIIELLNKKN